MTEKGHCKHGEFDLAEGCPRCVADKGDELRKGFEEEPVLEPPTALATTDPRADLEVMSFYNEACKLLIHSEQRVIATIEDLKPAVDDLAIIAKVKKGMEGKRKEYLQPFREHIDIINAAYKDLMAPVIKADEITRSKVLEFNIKQQVIHQKQEEINRKRQEAAEAEMELKGELTEPVGLVEVAPEAPKATRTASGTAGMRDNWGYEVTDFSAVSDAFKVIDGSQLTAIARKHHDQKPIPGIRFYNEPTISVRSK